MKKAAFSSFIAAGVSLAFLAVDAQQPAAAPGKAAPKGAVQGRLTWFDRQGKIVRTSAAPGLYRTLSISPDGKRVAFERTDPQSQNRDIWLLDIARDTTTRFTSDPAWDAFPLWSPDGRRIVFTSNRGGVYDLYQKASGGAGNEELLYRSGEAKGPTSWSPDGRFLIYYSLGQPTHVRLLPVSGPADRTPVPIVDSQFTSISGRFSPDGRWIAYVSNESGQNEISVRRFDSASGSIGKPVVVTHGGGRAPLWRQGSKELYYIAQNGAAVVAEVRDSATFLTGPPRELFNVPSYVLFWDVTPDGKRFLMPIQE